jgi:hypothetical protein
MESCHSRRPSRWCGRGGAERRHPPIPIKGAKLTGTGRARTSRRQLQIVEQKLCLLQIGRVEPLGKASVDGLKQGFSFT